MQDEEVGFQAVSYGEFRRNWWHCGFLDLLVGVDEVEGQSGMRFQGAAPAPLATPVQNWLRCLADPPMLP